MSRAVVIVDRFAKEAEALRATFDERFAEPRSTRADRFVWDWWHVPGQYTALRTPAWTYFPRRVYEAFHRRLVAWGRETLGCHDISPPWLSLYVDGCRQEFHGDLPHGPFAFVYSLTRWRGRVFSGGETLLLRDEVLDFWEDFRSVRGVEEPDILRAIEPRFDRLTVFDPRIPHGVRQVTGTRDPREGRLVIHGWFVQPRPFVRGPVRVQALSARIDELGGLLGNMLADLPIAGVLALAFTIDRRGGVRDLRVLSDTTRVPKAQDRDRVRVIRAMRAAIAAWKLGPQRAPSQVTLPIVFER
ncbi:MAG: 2OG-Fe(II) oxygenase [Kofleriaceae bacterium]|nr:2OG-Fe(II) oxygenase [Kofleriaceae bacterium]